MISPDIVIPEPDISPDSSTDAGYQHSFFPKHPGQYDANRPRFVPLSTQVAGHDGVLSDENGFVIIKPCSDDEIKFYEQCLSDVPAMMDCIPSFMGTLELNTPETLASMSPEVAAQIPADLVTVPVDPAFSPPNALYDRAVVLENLAFGYTKPCILDLKLGSVLHDDNATEEKRARLQKVSETTTSGSLGIRVAGMRVWDSRSAKAEEYERSWGKTLTNQTIYSQGLLKFLAARIRPQQMRLIVGRFLEDLQRIIDTIDDLEVRIYSPSLLFVYEGDQAALDLAIEDEGKQLIRDELGTGLEPHEQSQKSDDIPLSDDEDESSTSSTPAAQDFCICRMIDFAHAKFTPGAGRDENIMNGLKSARKLFETYLGGPQYLDIA